MCTNLENIDNKNKAKKINPRPPSNKTWKRSAFMILQRKGNEKQTTIRKLLKIAQAGASDATQHCTAQYEKKYILYNRLSALHVYDDFVQQQQTQRFLYAQRNEKEEQKSSQKDHT